MRQFIQYTFASLIGSCLGLLLFVGLGASSLIALLIAATVSESEPTVNKPSVLVFDLGLQIRDADPILGGREALEEALAGEDETIALRQILLALEEAATDENIVALYMAGDPLGLDAGFATLQEVRQALKAFREAWQADFCL
ncbi:MAG: hypothetical protein HC925_06250 [Coleofasciculaceae cyanobacterium SM2_3_26]|nr:hypothetical protein [Coleofasciculaceae cyanobacterium SM2_3_26]